MVDVVGPDVDESRRRQQKRAGTMDTSRRKVTLLPE
jgi:hypothetical protein